MTSREWWRAFTIGAVFSAGLGVIAMKAGEIRLTKRILAVDAQRDSLAGELASARALNESLAAEQQVHDATAARTSAIADEVVNTLGSRIQKLALPKAGVTPGGSDSGLFVPVADFMKVKNAFEAQRTRADFLANMRVPGLEAELRAAAKLRLEDLKAIGLRDERILQLERQQKLYLWGGVGLALVTFIALSTVND